MAARGKRKFTAKIDWPVVAELEALLKANPQLPFKSTNEAIQHAVSEYTEQLKARLGQTRLDPQNPPPLDQLLGFIEKYYKGKQVVPPASKKGRLG